MRLKRIDEVDLDTLKQTLRHIQMQMQQIQIVADQMEVSIYAVRDTSGAFLLAPLLVAKANLQIAIAQLSNIDKEQ